MLARRPLLYLTIPSLALLIGLWFRRKKAITAKRDSGGTNSSSSNHSLRENNKNAANSGGATAPLENSILRGGKPDISDSVPIANGSDDGDTSLLLNTSSGASSNSSTKGAPGPNSRSPPIPIANKPGCGGHTSDELNSVDEFDVESSVSPVDLQGSRDRLNFDFVKSNLLEKRAKASAMDVPPKVITANNSPKISPKNAFSEASATSTPSSKKGSNNNNKQQKTPKSAAGQKQQQQQQQPPQEAEESLIIQSPMAKLSLLDDSVNNNNNSVETKAQPTEIKSEPSVATSADKDASSTQEQPPTISSPPLSLCSNDSGKGSSPTQSEANVAENCYEFLVHEKYVGLLIGRDGSTVKRVHRRFNVHMIVRRMPNCPRPTDRVCAILGEASGIEAALAFVRARLPLDKYPDLTLERVHFSCSPVPRLSRDSSAKTANGAATQKPVMPIHYPVAQLPLSLSLVEGINNDVVISTILNGGHLFLQHPSHPTFQQLQAMQSLMTQNYATVESPVLDVLAPNSICVAPVAGVWFRVVIISHSAADQLCVVKFLDFGGFATVPAADLRQIRADFMVLPFQSTECVLSNLRPVGGQWSAAAAELVLQLGSGRMLQAQVAGYTADGLPEVYLYATLGPDSIVFVNRELVAQGFAEWVETEEDEEEELGVDTTNQQSVSVQ